MLSSWGFWGLLRVSRYTPNTEHKIRRTERAVICSFRNIPAAIAQNNGFKLKIKTSFPIEIYWAAISKKIFPAQPITTLIITMIWTLNSNLKKLISAFIYFP